MYTKAEIELIKFKALGLFDKAGIVLTAMEKKNLEIADFGLGEFYKTGLVLITYVNTEKCCAKELILFPKQTCPEHRHPPIDGVDGKEETFRCRWGTVYLYVEGEPESIPKCSAPDGREKTYTVWHQIILNPGDQYTLYPNTLHWFQAGVTGAIVSEFSTKSTDESDVFTDKEIVRMPELRD